MKIDLAPKKKEKEHKDDGNKERKRNERCEIDTHIYNEREKKK
jgi:hypothetical protein